MTYYFLALYYRYLNGFGPLQIGGVENALENAKINYAGFKGCIRNIKDNDLMYDLLNPLKERNTELGCKLENNLCPDCNDHGYCEPLWTNSICVCDLGYSGPNCNSSKIGCVRLEVVRNSSFHTRGVIDLPFATLSSPMLWKTLLCVLAPERIACKTGGGRPLLLVVVFHVTFKTENIHNR